MTWFRRLVDGGSSLQTTKACRLADGGASLQTTKDRRLGGLNSSAIRGVIYMLSILITQLKFSFVVKNWKADIERQR